MERWQVALPVETAQEKLMESSLTAVLLTDSEWNSGRSLALQAQKGGSRMQVPAVKREVFNEEQNESEQKVKVGGLDKDAAWQEREHQGSRNPVRIKQTNAMSSHRPFTH